jgi:hypothetical protein
MMQWDGGLYKHMIQALYCYRRRKLICLFKLPWPLSFDRSIASFFRGVVVRGPRAQLNCKDRIAVWLGADRTARKKQNEKETFLLRTMKFAVFASLLASAAAFVPVAQQNKATTTSLNAFENELGAQQPLGFWDPLKLVADGAFSNSIKRSMCRTIEAFRTR